MCRPLILAKQYGTWRNTKFALLAFALVLCQSCFDELGATAGLSSSAEFTVGQAN